MATSFTELAFAPRKHGNGFTCSACNLIDRLPADQLEALKIALKRGVSAREVVETAAAMGYTLSPGSWARHRRYECVGYKTGRRGL